MNRRQISAMLFLLCSIVFASLYVLWYAMRDYLPAETQVPLTTPTIMIDAGHGGEDGGAVSLTGAVESQINLAIACKLEDMLAFWGTPPLMLRREDRSLHDPSASTIREKKVSDLHNRVDMVEQADPRLFLSIHQNSFPEKKYHGAQVFFADTPDSDMAAQHVQRMLTEKLGQGSARKAKKISSTVYLMNHISCPAILVECGFLSNPEEEALLRQDTYQRKLAAILCGSVLSIPARGYK